MKIRFKLLRSFSYRTLGNNGAPILVRSQIGHKSRTLNVRPQGLWQILGIELQDQCMTSSWQGQLELWVVGHFPAINPKPRI